MELEGLIVSSHGNRSVLSIYQRITEQIHSSSIVAVASNVGLVGCCPSVISSYEHSMTPRARINSHNFKFGDFTVVFPR